MENQHTKTNKYVLVTGATGYISSYVIKLLLEAGYKVKGTVRSLEAKQKYAHLLHLQKAENLELVQAELQNQNCWDKILKDCDYVIHIASPVPPYIPQDQNEIIKPAVQGSINVLNASIKHKVKRFIYTSSCLTLYCGNQGKVLDQSYWGDPNKCAHYPKSKILAQKAVWQIYHKQNIKGQHTEVVSVLPSFVLGPVMTIHKNSSETFITQVINGKFPGVPNPDITYTAVDVRDAALGHFYALFQPSIDGQRIALAAGQITFQQIINILRDAYPNNNIKTDKLTLQQLKTSNSPIAQRNISFMGKKYDVNNQKSLDLLGINYRNLKQTVLQMGQSLVKLGAIN